MSEGILEDEWCSRAGGREQFVQNGPCAVGGAGRLQHLANASVFNLGNVEVDGGTGDGACLRRGEAVKEGPRHSARARLRSSCSKALAMRLISAARAPASLAVTRQVAVTAATSLMITRAWASESPKKPAADSSKSTEQVHSSRSMFVVRTRALRSVGTGLRS